MCVRSVKGVICVVVVERIYFGVKGPMDPLVKTSAAKTLGDEFSRVQLSSQSGNGDGERESVTTWNKKRGSSASMTKPKATAAKATNNGTREEDLWGDSFEVQTSARNVRRRSSSTISTGKSAAPKTSVYRGVSYNRKNRKWKAVITYHGKQHFLGYFLSEMSAAKAYDKASHKRRGPTASLNFPSEISTEEEETPNLHKTSRYRGVSFCKSNKKWKAVITYKGKQTYLGYFTSEIDAAKCYDRAARKNRGRNALTNFESVPSDVDKSTGNVKMEVEVKAPTKRKQKRSKSSVPQADQSMRGVLGVYDMEEKSAEGQDERKMDLDDTRISFDTIGFTESSREFGKDSATKLSPNSLATDMSFHAPYDNGDTDFLKIKDSFIKKLPGFDEEVKEEDKQFLSYLSKNDGDDGVYSPYEMHELDSYLEFAL